MDLARFRSVRRMSGDGHEGDYRTVAIAVEEMRGNGGRERGTLEDPVLAVEEDVEVAGAPALERLIEVGGWPRSLSFCLSLFLNVTR